MTEQQRIDPNKREFRVRNPAQPKPARDKGRSKGQPAAEPHVDTRNPDIGGVEDEEKPTTGSMGSE